MDVRLPYRVKAIILVLSVLFSASQAFATHIFGVDLYYTWVSGNTYTINLVMYGDCSGAAFGTFPTSSPEIDIYNGATFSSTLTLTLQAPTTGVEVTPVCPADAGLTTCTNPSYSIPGVKKFVYSGNITLPGTSSVWRFLFSGVMGSSSAGRSTTITNIVGPGSTIIQLVDTLNNTVTNNSSAVYTTIPTPFFCLGVPENFNPGAVDPNGDSLSFFLVPGMDASTSTAVSYITPYTATAPLAATPGTFSFSNTTGQLSFTPNALQKSLVVYNVEEYRGAMLKGTSQREMTVVVLTCTNTPPSGVISSPSAGTLSSPTTLNICANTGVFSFHINPTDPDGNNITMSVAGLPGTSTFFITGNGTTAPTGTFTWTTTGVTPGTYIFYITYRDDGCPMSGTQTIAYTINILPVPTELFSLVSPATCVKKAVFHVTPGGSASPWTMKVIQGGITIQTITGVTGMVTDSLVPGTYKIRMLNPSGCYADTTITLVAPTYPIPSVTTTPPLCPGGATGSATITATGGLAPYRYAIGTGLYGTSGTFTGLTPGTYTLHVKDSNNCIKDTVITVPNAVPILMHIGIQRPLCDTYSNGIVVINAYNSVGPYTYALGTGPYSSNDTFTHLGAGTYTFHVKNANGCIVDTTFAITDSVTIHASLAIAPVLCNGGSATVTVSGIGGFGPPYTYAYGTGTYGSSGVFTLPAGTYTFHVHDPNACYFDTSVTLTQPSPITITPVLTNILCNGAATGMIVVNATGGTPTYQYNMDGGTYGTSNTFAGLSAGMHIARVKDANGCIYADTVMLTQPTALHIDSVVMVKPTCNGLSNGSITVYASGGVTAYTYAHDAGTYGISHTFSSMAAGTYVMHVKDANGCVKDTTITLTQPTAVSPSATVTPSLCQTLTNGKVVLGATGGTPGFTYALGTGSYGSSGTFTPLAAGIYTFHVKDANGCIHDTTLTVTDSMTVTATFVITPPLCFNQPAGIIIATGGGGVSPYTYALGAGSYDTGSVFSGLLAGSYMMHIRDANGCKDDTAVVVTQPTDIVPAIAITEPSCYGYNNGSITVSASGGTPGFTYALNSGAFGTSTTYASLSAGTDTIRVKDANGCLHDTVIAVQQPTQVQFANIIITNISCYNGGDGTVNVTGNGATPPYVYATNASSWQSGNLFTGFSAGAVTVKVKDNNGCELDTVVTLTQPPALVITGADTVNPTCEGYKDGSVALHVAGGTPAYTYSDDNVNFIAFNVFNGLGEGTYVFNIKDANGCTADTAITLVGLPHIIVDSIGLTQPLCNGYSDGIITISASGGVPALVYQLSNVVVHSAPASFSGLHAGDYLITITDSRNCKKDTVIYLPQPDVLAITTAVTPNECIGEDNKGVVIATVTGGTQPYSYLWSNASITAGITGLANGSYTVQVKDANGCFDSVRSEVAYDNCCTPFIPNAFTPNGDGKNDDFKIYFKGDMYIIRFSVYNRFGQVVYSICNTNDPNLAWNGKLDGVDAELGTYYYYAKIICGNKGNKIVELKGDVTLIR